jgi:hypothetical protein
MKHAASRWSRRQLRGLPRLRRHLREWSHRTRDSAVQLTHTEPENDIAYVQSRQRCSRDAKRNYELWRFRVQQRLEGVSRARPAHARFNEDAGLRMKGEAIAGEPPDRSPSAPADPSQEGARFDLHGSDESNGAHAGSGAE